MRDLFRRLFCLKGCRKGEYSTTSFLALLVMVLTLSVFVGLSSTKSFQDAYASFVNARRLEGSTSLNACLKPRIYQTEEEIPDDKKNPEWPTQPMVPGMSERIYYVRGLKSTSPTGGNYSIRLGIETDKWDSLVSQGICPPVWIKENVVDVMNRMLAEARDANGDPVKTRIVLLSWELYDRHFYANTYGDPGWINYVPRWYLFRNRNTGRDITWLVRPAKSEITDEYERNRMNIYNDNNPAIGAIDAPCLGPGDYDCWNTVIHETAHAMDVGDLYAWDVYDFENQVNGVAHTTVWGEDVMKDPSVLKFSAYSATNLNRIYKARTEGIYNNREWDTNTSAGAFYRSNNAQERPYSFVFQALPRYTFFEFYDPEGNFVINPRVEVIPSNRRCVVNSGLPECDSRFDRLHSQFFKGDRLESVAYVNESVLSEGVAGGVDMSRGVLLDSYLLTRRDKNYYQNPTIEPERAIHFMFLVPVGDRMYGKIVEVTELNMAYHRGETELAKIRVDLEDYPLDLQPVRVRPELLGD